MSLCVCAGKAGLAGDEGSAEGCGGAASPGPSTRDLGSPAVVEVTSPLRVRVGKTANLTSLGRF